MKRYAGKRAFVGLLLMSMALLVLGCASDGTSSYSQTEDGYYGVYGPGYYYDDHDHHDDGGGTSRPPPTAKPSPPPRPTQLPARPLPRPAPRPAPRRR
jgi:hypothetical protein